MNRILSDSRPADQVPGYAKMTLAEGVNEIYHPEK